MSHDPAGARLVVEPQYAISDPQVSSLIRNMSEEIRAGCPAGRLYGEALSLALAAYLYGRYSRRRAPVGPRRIALSPAQMRRVREFVSENLSADIGLSELANQTGLSPHYFSLLFKRAFGVPPYRYVLSTRIDRAKRLLSERKMPMSDIALELGFADQSHFSKTFKAFVGTTPRQYRSLS
jgi:AraC family transcriptional regulator